MQRTKPIIFTFYPKLERKLPWLSLLTNVPTSVERLIELEKKLDLKDGEIYIKRDDKNHDIYGGNKLRKLEFILGDAIKKRKKGIVTFGGIGTNHGLACAIICSKLNLPLKCELFLYNQPLTWHVQRSLLLFDCFKAKLHYGKTDIGTFIKAFIFQIFHPKYYFVLPGGSPLFGRGTPLGTVGFIDAIYELNEQIKDAIIPEPDAIFIAAATTGSTAGLVAGCKLLNLKTKVYPVAVYKDFMANSSNIVRIANKTLKFLNKRDKTFPKMKISKDDFNLIEGYLGSGYGIKTKKSQKAVDIINKLEGEKRDFHLETTYTGKAIAAMFDFLEKKENKSKKVIFWNTYNSNDLDIYLKGKGYHYETLPKKFHKFFESKIFQCWQLTNCPEETKSKCIAYLHHEYRFWKLTKCLLGESEQEKAFRKLKSVIELENA